MIHNCADNDHASRGILSSASFLYLLALQLGCYPLEGCLDVTLLELGEVVVVW
jgi:hypothetical protein